MSNMSYCRFRNTLADLRDCQNALQDRAEMADVTSHMGTPNGHEEYTGREELIELCREIAEEFEDADFPAAGPCGDETRSATEETEGSAE